MKNLFACIVLLFCFIGFSSCEKSQDLNSNPTNLTSSKKGGNGNGNGGGSVPYTVINTAPTNWNVTYDTSYCGKFKLMWNAQPGAVEYYVNVIERPWNCAGSAVQTNVWWYTYGYGCSMIVGNIYHIQLSYFIKDDINKVTTYFYSDTIEVKTGSYGLWNCP